MLKQAEEEQIKKFCRVDNLGEIVNGGVEDERMQLEAMAKGIEEEIGRVEKENGKIREDLEIVMTTVKENRKN